MNSNDIFSQRAEQRKPQIPEEKKQDSEGDIFSQQAATRDETKKNNEAETWLQWGKRQLKRSAGVVLTEGAGAAGSAAKLAQYVGAKAAGLLPEEKPISGGLEAISFGLIPDSIKKIAEDLDKDAASKESKVPNFISKMLFPMPGVIGGPFSTTLPTGSDIRERLIESTGGTPDKEKKGSEFAPRNKAESMSDEILSGFTNMFLSRNIPGATKAPIRSDLIRSISVPAFGTVVKEGAKELGVSPEKAEYLKMGSMLLADMAGIGNANQAATEAMNRSERMVPRNALSSVEDTNRLLSAVDAYERRLLRGGTSPEKAPTLTKLQEIRQAAKDNFGQIPIHDLLQFKHTINSIKRNLGGFGIEETGKAAAIANLNRVYRHVDKTLGRWGRRNNPEFLQANRLANQAYAITEKSNTVARYIQKKYQKPMVSDAAKILFTGSSFLSPSMAVGALPLAAAYQSYKILHRVMASPLLRNYYFNVVNQSLRNNASAAISNFEKLDKALSKDKD